MDVRRHVTAGRLAELFGEDALETDKFVRTHGLAARSPSRSCRCSSRTPAPRSRPTPRASTPTSTTARRRRSRSSTPCSRRRPRLPPEPWTAVDSLAWLKAMAWDLRGNMDDEIDRVLAPTCVGPSAVAELYPPYPYDEHEPIVGQGAVVDGVFEQDAAEPAAPATRSGRRSAARRWPALAARPGRRSSADARAARPRRRHRQQQLGRRRRALRHRRAAPRQRPAPRRHACRASGCRSACTAATVSRRRARSTSPGFTFSGVPGVIIGHNADIAWGFTNLGPDVTDLYLEKVAGDRWQLRRPAARPLRPATETIEVPRRRRRRDHRPVDRARPAALRRRRRAGRRRARRRGGARPDREGGGVRRVAGVDRARAAPDRRRDPRAQPRGRTGTTSAPPLADFAVPAQNLVYADREGHIGYQAPGPDPDPQVRQRRLLPAAGWRPENDWTGEYVPFDGAAERARPRRGVHRHRQPGGDRRATTPTS